MEFGIIVGILVGVMIQYLVIRGAVISAGKQLIANELAPLLGHVTAELRGSAPPA